MAKVIRKHSIRTDTKSYTLLDLMNEVNEDRAILCSLGYDTSENQYFVDTFSNNIYKLGNCHRRGNNYTISLNADYILHCKPEEVHNTIMHEVIHSCKDCMNHGPKWKRVANAVMKNYGFKDIDTTNSWEDWNSYINTKAKYIAKCKKCGQMYYWYKKGKYYNLCKSGRGGCGVCHSHEFECSEN